MKLSSFFFRHYCLSILLVSAPVLRVVNCWQVVSKSSELKPASKEQWRQSVVPSTQRRPMTTSTLRALKSNCDGSTSEIEQSRRQMLLRSAMAVSSLASCIVISATVTPAMAASDNDASAILLRLRSIPTFSLVDPNGVPFMIFDGQASATGYFFLSFDVAAQALRDARQKDKNAGATEVWANAKIIVVPLAVALQLALRKSQREAVNNGIKFNTFNDIVPSQEGVDDAKALEGTFSTGKWEQKGRAPLFYFEGLTLSDGREPRYFNQRDLLAEWERQHPGTAPPKVRVTELVEVFRAASKNEFRDVANLAIMPVAESNQVASQLLKAAESPLPKYDFNKVFLVGSAQG